MRAIRMTEEMFQKLREEISHGGLDGARIGYSPYVVFVHKNGKARLTRALRVGKYATNFYTDGSVGYRDSYMYIPLRKFESWSELEAYLRLADQKYMQLASKDTIKAEARETKRKRKLESKKAVANQFLKK